MGPSIGMGARGGVCACVGMGEFVTPMFGSWRLVESMRQTYREGRFFLDYDRFKHRIRIGVAGLGIVFRNIAKSARGRDDSGWTVGSASCQSVCKKRPSRHISVTSRNRSQDLGVLISRGRL